MSRGGVQQDGASGSRPEVVPFSLFAGIRAQFALALVANAFDLFRGMAILCIYTGGG